MSAYTNLRILKDTNIEEFVGKITWTNHRHKIEDGDSQYRASAAIEVAG